MGQAVEPWFGVAPEQPGERGEAVFLDRPYFLVGELGIQPAGSGQGAEGAVALMAPCPAGDLGHFGSGQAAMAHPVELGQAGEGNVVHIEVEPHADGIGCHEIIDLARLEQGNLAVARFGGKRAHDHRRTAAEAAQHFGHGIDLLGRECDDGAARGHPRKLLRPGMAERGEARTADHFGLGHQGAYHWFQHG